jgi:ATP-dependent DNA ligase
MKAFAELLNRLSYEPSRNNKLRLIANYLRSTPDPERGWALAALTGALAFRQAKPSLLRTLVAERTDPVLFELSLDYVGDLSETIALMWPAAAAEASPPALSEVIAGLASLGKAELPAQVAHWLDVLDETGRWALLKLVTGELRIGVSARLAKTAAAALGNKDPEELELLWPALRPPFGELFAWLEGRDAKPVNRDPAAFRPPMLAHAIEESELSTLNPADFIAEWKWDGIRLQAVAGRDPSGRIVHARWTRAELQRSAAAAQS